MGDLGYIKRIKEIEDEVASIIRMNHTRELKVVDAALDQILRGLDDFGSRKQQPDNRLESARLFLTVRSFNSLRIARQTLERGYYQQALTLVRMVMEDQLVVEDVENHPPTLIALLEGEGKLGKPNLTFGNMAERLSPKSKEVWDDDYGTLSKRAAHPRLESMQGLTAIEPDGQVTLRPGSHYDLVEARIVLYYLLRQLVQVMKTTTTLTTPVESDWVKRTYPGVQGSRFSLKEIDEWAGDQLGKSTESLEWTHSWT